jgi:hypothetical protein
MRKSNKLRRVSGSQQALERDEEKCVRFSARIRSNGLVSITFLLLGQPDLKAS